MKRGKKIPCPFSSLTMDEQITLLHILLLQEKNLNIRFLLFKSSRRRHCYLDSKKILSCYLNTNRIFHWNNSISRDFRQNFYHLRLSLLFTEIFREITATCKLNKHRYLLCERFTIRRPDKPANWPNCSTSILFLLRSRLCKPVKGRKAAFCKSMILLATSLSSWRLSKFFKSLLDTSDIRL